MKKLLYISAAVLFGALPSLTQAKPLQVVADIAPVRALIETVAGDNVEIELLIGPADSPHEYAMRPRQALAVQEAAAVFWVGPELSPWMQTALGNLGDAVNQVVLGQTEGTTRLIEAVGDGVDPHMWLDPHNARVWLGRIADTLGQKDPENAALYQANAKQAGARIGKTTDEIAARLKGLQGKGYVVYHDAFHYFENRFGLSPVGAVTQAEDTPPSAAAILKIRNTLAAHKGMCMLFEPDANPKLLATVTEGVGAKQVPIDPLGRDIAVNAMAYETLLDDIADSFASCL